jgi:outer membrane protein
MIIQQTRTPMPAFRSQTDIADAPVDAAGSQSRRTRSSHHRVRRAALATLVLPGVLAVAGLFPRTAQAQLTLRDALSEGDRAAYANRAAAGTAAADRARILAPLKGIVPSARLEAGLVRTTDPIGAFGTLLRQREVTPAAFDPARLNFPAAVSNYQTGAVIEVPLLNGDAWAGRAAARHAADASDAQLDWTRTGTRSDVVRAYYGAVLASVSAATLEHASRAGQANVAQAEAMVRQGMVTRSDALLAQVRAGEIQAQLAEARGNAATSRHQLAVLLGRSAAAIPEVPAALPAPARIRAVTAGDTAEISSGVRADVDGARLMLQGARADARRAKATLLPRVNSFARYDWNAPSGLFAQQKNWTVGVVASWNLFTGASELSEIRAAAGRETAARAGAEASVAKARLEEEQTRTQLIVALQRLDLAEEAAVQSAEAYRLVARRYAGGLATVAELLDAHATETTSALALAAAGHRVIAASAARRQAIGLDPGTLSVLEEVAVADRDADALPPLSR